MTDHTPPTDADLDLIEQRAAHLYEYDDLPDDVDILTGTEVPALVAEVRRLRAIEAVAIEVRAKHKPRTERHGSGCVQCGIVWPCPTYKALDDAARPAVRPAVETGARPA